MRERVEFVFSVQALDEQMATEFDGYRNNNNYKVCETGWLFLTVLESLKNDDKLKSFNSLPKQVLEYQRVSKPSKNLCIILCNFSIVLSLEGFQQEQNFVKNEFPPPSLSKPDIPFIKNPAETSPGPGAS